MPSRTKAILVTLGLLSIAAVFGLRAAWKYDTQGFSVGVVLSGIVAVGFLFGAISNLQRSRSTDSSPPGDPPGVGP